MGAIPLPAGAQMPALGLPLVEGAGVAIDPAPGLPIKLVHLMFTFVVDCPKCSCKAPLRSLALRDPWTLAPLAQSVIHH